MSSVFISVLLVVLTLLLLSLVLQLLGLIVASLDELDKEVVGLCLVYLIILYM